MAAPGAPPVRARFDQSTFRGTPVPLARLRRRGASYVPNPGEKAQVELPIVRCMFERRPLREIAQSVADEHPGRFRTWHEAMDRVGKLSVAYSDDLPGESAR